MENITNNKNPYKSPKKAFQNIVRQTFWRFGQPVNYLNALWKYMVGIANTIEHGVSIPTQNPDIIYSRVNALKIDDFWKESCKPTLDRQGILAIFPLTG